MKLPRTPSFRLDGKRALVPGGSSGIGLGAAVALAEAGAAVTLAARGEARLDEAVGALREAGMEADGLVMDVADVEAVRTSLAEREPYDILVNAAGFARHGPSRQTRAEDFRAVSEANLMGAYFLAQIVADRLIEAGRPGSIVTISSQMGHVGGRERAAYCATKHGVEGFTKAMAIEWGPHRIRINTLCPTFVRTPLTQATFDDPEKRAWVEGMIKLGRVAEVEDLMGPVLLLVSDAGAMITGTHLLVDGGWTAD